MQKRKFTHSYFFCCSSTNFTLTIGTLQLFCVIISAISSNWPSFTLNLLMLTFFVVFLYDPKNVKYRKILYYAFKTTSLPIFYAEFENNVIMPYFSPETCKNDTTFLENSNECVDFSHYMAFLSVITFMCIAVPLRMLICRILFLGW